MSVKISPSRLFLFSAFALIILGFVPGDALAQTPVANVFKCPTGGLNAVFCTLSNELRSTPKLITTLSWIVAVIMGFTALLNLKEYGDDPTKIPLRSIIIKFILCVLLITFPFVISSVRTSLTGTNGQAANMVDPVRTHRGQIVD
ncbi:MAG: hypothetical protein JWM96_1193 [Alphaproteobacteria bacterium]|nr:hypothetical protein [Alphaproteobacteria bacterium]